MTLDELRALATGSRDGYRVWQGDLGKMAVTLEDAEFLYALVRVTKPQKVLELGTGLGVSGRFIAEALAANGSGSLLTVEPRGELWSDAERLFDGLSVAISADEPSWSRAADLVFIDSGWQNRPTDIASWLTDGYQGLVCVHDAGRDYPGLAKGIGVFLPGSDGLWLGRAA